MDNSQIAEMALMGFRTLLRYMQAKVSNSTTQLENKIWFQYFFTKVYYTQLASFSSISKTSVGT